MSILRTADERQIPPEGWFWLLIYCLVMFALVATFTPIRMPRSSLGVPRCGYCAIGDEFVRSCSGGCDERV